MDWRNRRPKKLKRAAYLYAEAAPDENGKTPAAPTELDDLYYIDRFGVEAVMGRKVLSFREMRAMLSAESVSKSYRLRKDSGDWAKWAATYPEQSKQLVDIEKELNAPD